MICKVCGKEQHFCSSCGYDPYKFEDYCDEVCFKSSEEYKTYYKKLKKFWNSLNKEQKLELWALWDNGIFIDDKWETVIDSIFVDERDSG